MTDIDTVRDRILTAIELAQQDVLDEADKYRSRYHLEDSEVEDIFKMIGEHDLADAWKDYIKYV